MMLVSAVITTRNRSTLLCRAIESVIAQTYKDIEIIVVDDGSTDDTENLISEYLESFSNIRYLKNTPPKGACAARNYGIRSAKGEFIAGLDDDDEWLPRRIEVLVENFKDEYAYVCSRDLVVYQNRVEKRKKANIITFNKMLYHNITGNQILTKRDRVLKVGGFDENLTAGQDYDLWLRLLEKYGSAIMVPEPLQRVYRDHVGERVSISKGKIKGDWRLYKKYKAKMTRRQRKLRLMELKRLRSRRITLTETLSIINTGYFLKFFRYYLRKRLGRI